MVRRLLFSIRFNVDKKQLLWKPSKGKYSGYTDFGGECGSDLASEMLVFMIVSLTKRFNSLIALFYVNKINSSLLSRYTFNFNYKTTA